MCLSASSFFAPYAIVVYDTRDVHDRAVEDDHRDAEQHADQHFPFVGDAA